MRSLQTAFPETLVVEELLEQSPYRLLYRGSDRTSGRSVLIYHWATAMITSTEQKERLEREVTLFQRLAHPHILPVSEILIQQRGLSLVSPYPAQGSLQARLSALSFHPFPPGEARLILQQVGLALHHAHQHHILHGALTPGAIFFTEDHHIVVSGFRFQSILAAIPDYQPEQEERLPKLWYMAPEQFDGVLDEKSDQYALGCLAYALLTGHVPFPGYTRATLVRKHQNESPKPLSAYNPNISANIENAILVALAKQPDLRHASIQYFLQALEEPVWLRASSTLGALSQGATRSESAPANAAVRKISLPSLQTLAQNLSSVGWKKFLVKKAHAPIHTPLGARQDQRSSGFLRKGERLYVPAVILLILIMTTFITTVAASRMSGSSTLPTILPTPGRRANNPSSSPTPIIVHNPTFPAAPTQGVTPTATPVAVRACQVRYVVVSQVFRDGDDLSDFTALIRVTNTGNVPINGWALTFTFPGNQRITSSANALFTQQYQHVMLTNLAGNRTIAVGQSLTITILGKWLISNPSPTMFVLNNMVCQ
jgi:serine/threonine protein kinase